MLEYPLLLVFPACMFFAMAFDLFTMTIPNRISIALAAAFVLVAPLAGLTLEQIGMHLLVGFGALAVGFGLFARGWLGGGDCKLLAASALWLGSEPLIEFLVTVAMFGGVLSLVILAYRVYVPADWLRGPQWLRRLHVKGAGIPYGLAVGAAALSIYPHTLWFAALLG